MSLHYCDRVAKAIQRLLDHEDTSFYCLPELEKIKKRGETLQSITDDQAEWAGRLHGQVINGGKYVHLDWWTGYHDRPARRAAAKEAKEFEKIRQDILEKKLERLMLA